MYIVLIILALIGLIAIVIGVNNLWRLPDWILIPVLTVMFIVICTLLVIGIWA